MSRPWDSMSPQEAAQDMGNMPPLLIRSIKEAMRRIWPFEKYDDIELERLNFRSLDALHRFVLRAEAEIIRGRHSKSGIFRDHRCWRCNDGEKPCINGSPNNCDYPRARND